MSDESMKAKRVETLTEEGWYWWLAICYDLEYAKEEEWQVVYWHPDSVNRVESGWVAGPLHLPEWLVTDE